MSREWGLEYAECHIYIYVATSVMSFGAILFTPIRFTVKLWFFVNPERSLVAYLAILDPPHPPTSSKSLPFIPQQTESWPLSQLTNTVLSTPLFMAGTRVHSIENINTDLPNKHEAFSTSVQWRTVTHVLRRKSYTKINIYRYSRSHWRAVVELRHSVGVVGQ
jgi:hypothetical protein